jgi:Rab GDP dissociation inhibitor
MDESYDCIVLGTGLKECILSGLLSVNGYKVLHMDANSFYGGASASLNLQQAFEKFKGGATPPASLGPSRDYNLDLVPKFIMAAGLLTKILVRTDVTRYLDFKVVDCSYVYKDKKIHKVPSGPAEAATSSLMGMFEKNRCRKFLEFCQGFDEKDVKTHGGKFDFKTVTMEEVFKYWGLDVGTIDFLGHAVALYRDDAYLKGKATECIARIQLYWEGIARYVNSPYIYPLYGLGELPQAFARLAAIYGGTYMLGKKIDEIVYEDGVAVGVKSEGEVARAKFVVGDPSYFPTKVRKTGAVVRAICILSHPVKDTKAGVESLQIIVPAKQCGRQSDVYVTLISNAHNVCPKGKFIAVAAASVENPSAPEKDLALALSLLEPIDERFVYVSDVMAPIADGTTDKCFISTSYDETSHFETAATEVVEMYQRITGKPLDLESDIGKRTEGQ